MTVASFDIGGTRIKHGAVADDGTILAQDSLLTPLSDVTEFLSALTEIVTAYKTTFPELSAVGISAPGLVSADGVMTTFGKLYNYYGLPLAENLSDTTKLPVFVENDANCAAIAEHWLGAARAVDNYLVVTLGTAVGGGIISGGKIFRGAHGMAGEFGSMLTHGLTRVGELEDVSQQYHSSAINGLLRRYNDAQKSVSHGKAVPLTEAYDVIARVKAEENLAEDVFDTYLDDVCLGLMNLTALFDPKLILIGGGISSSEAFLVALKYRFERLVSRHFGLNSMKENGILPRLAACQLRNDAGLLGAAYITQTR
ncbi:MAG: ROK family protein [Streptococcaceae bacterium]|jgi:predicted NBD/HSP70 family sugar kinase|nr:ROK family protein [Streptococcaceae bacterium]